MWRIDSRKYLYFYRMLKKIFSTTFYQPIGHLWLLLLRMVISIFMIIHGFPKLMKLFSGNIEFADPLGIGELSSLSLVVFAEVICSILIFFGAATRIASIPLIITMAVAAFVIHQDDPFMIKEKAFLYLLIYFNLLIFGPGKYSVDNRIGK